MKRKEMLEALEKVANNFACNGNETSNYIADALRQLIEELKK